MQRYQAENVTVNLVMGIRSVKMRTQFSIGGEFWQSPLAFRAPMRPVLK